MALRSSGTDAQFLRNMHSIDTKQKQLDYLYYQTLYIIDQYKTVSLNKINNRIPNLQCDAQTLFSYLHKQQYFCDVQDKQY